MSPIISIIVPVFNRRSLLGETVESVLAQTSDQWELILVDDGSTDGSDILAEEYARTNERIYFYRRDTVIKGAPACRNLGFRKSKGEFIIFLDSDDLLAPYCIKQRLASFANHPEMDLLIFPMVLFQNRFEDMRILHNIPTNESDLDRFIKRENVWLISSPVWKRSAFQQLGGFNEHYLSYQDWEINVKALIFGLNYTFLSNATPDHFYRQHTGTTISAGRFSPAHNKSNALMIIEVYRLLQAEKKAAEARRLALAGFFTDVVMRYRFSENPSAYRGEIEDLVKQALASGLLSKRESVLVSLYFRLHILKVSFVFGTFRTLIDRIFKRGLLKELYPVHISHQLKHRYDGTFA